MAMMNSRPAPLFTITKTSTGTTAPRPAIAPRARHMTAAEWYQRAVDLAESQHLDYSLRFAGVLDGDLIYTAPSASAPHMRHKLHLNLEREFLSCDCPAHLHKLPCGHLGALFLLMRRAQRHALPQNLRGQVQYEFWSDSLSAS